MSKMYKASLTYSNCHKKEKGLTLVIYDAVSPKVDQHFYIWSGYCIPNINFKHRIAPKILCPQHFIIDPYIQVVKRKKSLLMDQWKNKKYGSAYFSYRKCILSFRVLNKSTIYEASFLVKLPQKRA